MKFSHPRSTMLVAIILSASSVVSAATISNMYELNVEIVQVCDDAGGNCAALDATNDPDRGYVYESVVNEIWAQAGIQVNFTYSTWNETDALRMDSTERGYLYSHNTTAIPNLPAIGVDALQIFFVDDHPGTGYSGTAGTGWVDNPLADPMFSARNAGNMQLYIDTVVVSNGRGVMANEGFEADQLGGTIAHEIGHAMGLRHIGDPATNTMVNGSNVDPTVSLTASDPNVMWEAFAGPAYDNSMTLAENFALNCDQIMAVIHNGMALDPDGNGIGVLTQVPEPSSMGLLVFGGLMMFRRCRR